MRFKDLFDEASRSTVAARGSQTLRGAERGAIILVEFDDSGKAFVYVVEGMKSKVLLQEVKLSKSKDPDQLAQKVAFFLEALK